MNFTSTSPEADFTEKVQGQLDHALANCLMTATGVRIFCYSKIGQMSIVAFFVSAKNQIVVALAKELRDTVVKKLAPHKLNVWDINSGLVTQPKTTGGVTERVHNQLEMAKGWSFDGISGHSPKVFLSEPAELGHFCLLSYVVTCEPRIATLLMDAMEKTVDEMMQRIKPGEPPATN
jgi:hypothetical protein